MGWITIESQGKTRRVPLAPQNFFGRNRTLTWPIPGAQLPGVWVEVRWFGDREKGYWAVRKLVEPDYTHILTVPLPSDLPPLRRGWSFLRPRLGLSHHRNNAETTIWIEPGDDGPPFPFAVGLSDEGGGEREILVDGAFRELFEFFPEGARPVGWDDDVLSAPEPLVRNDQVCVVAGRAYRIHWEAAVEHTELVPLKISDPDLELTLQRSGREYTAIFRWTEQVDEPSHTVTGQGASLLVPYVRARKLGVGLDEGWITRAQALADWVEYAGGDREMSLQAFRERHRETREPLSERGVTGAKDLWEKGYWAFDGGRRERALRLGIPPGRIRADVGDLEWPFRDEAP